MKALRRGAAVALVVLALELILVLRAQAVGIDIDIKGPLRALLDAVGGQLSWLGARIAFAYLVGFCAVSLLASFIAWGARVRPWPVFLMLLSLAVWIRAIRTPALFDDLPGGYTWFVPFVRLGAPWHVLVAAIAGFIVLFVYAWRQRTMWKLALVSATLFIVALWGVPRYSAPESKQPLVIIFGVDALRPDRLGTGIVPNLDRFVTEAARFDRAYTPIATTDGAWRSMLTARYPAEHGVRYSLTADAVQNTTYDTFARAFLRAGFTTAFRTDCSRFHFEDETSGFAVRAQPPKGAVNFLYEKLRFRFLSILDLGFVPELTQNRALAGMYDAEADAHALAKDIVQRSGAPLLYAYHATAAHFPGDAQYPFYHASPELRMRFATVKKGERPPPPDTQLYDALLRQADMQFAVMRRALEEAGLWEHATVMVLSDHGEEFLGGSASVHGAVLDEQQYHVVLALKHGDKRRIDAFVRLIDVGPTLLDLAGLPALPDVPGRSLVPLLRGEALEPAPMIAETSFTHVDPDYFVPEHYTGALRTFEAYDLGKDGTVAVKQSVHEAIMREKDFGVFDGDTWLIRWRDKNGKARFRCVERDGKEVPDIMCKEGWYKVLDAYAER